VSASARWDCTRHMGRMVLQPMRGITPSVDRVPKTLSGDEAVSADRCPVCRVPQMGCILLCGVSGGLMASC